MSRNRLHLPLRPTPGRLVAAAVVALALVVTAATFLPDGRHRDGALTPATEREYAATTGAPGPGTVDAAARAEIDRVLADSPDGTSARTTLVGQAARLMRCAEFEGQRYCLGRGWTQAEESEVQARAAASASRRTTATETTGDLSDADFLAQRAAMDPAEREAAERAELEAAAQSVAKVVLLRHQVLGDPLPAGFLERHPEARATTSAGTTSARQAAARPKLIRDYPRRSTVLRPRRTSEQVRSYWCGPATMQMITWGWSHRQRSQKHWARRLGTTTSGSAISEMVRVVNQDTGWDRDSRAGRYVVLDISDYGYKKWLLLTMRHIEDYRAPMVYHPILLKRFYPYLDDDASGHFQVGRGYDKRGRKPADVGYFEPWNQQRFDPSEPYINRVQWRSAYRSYRANRAHPHQNIGV